MYVRSLAVAALTERKRIAITKEYIFTYSQETAFYDNSIVVDFLQFLQAEGQPSSNDIFNKYSFCH
jgi:hypothetical protein